MIYENTVIEWGLHILASGYIRTAFVNANTTKTPHQCRVTHGNFYATSVQDSCGQPQPRVCGTLIGLYQNCRYPDVSFTSGDFWLISWVHVLIPGNHADTSSLDGVLMNTFSTKNINFNGTNMNQECWLPHIHIRGTLQIFISMTFDAFYHH